MYRYYKSSPDLFDFVDVDCIRVDLSDFALKRRDDPVVLRRADWRRGVQCLFAPTLWGYHELDQLPDRGSVVLHGFPAFDRVANLGPELCGVFKIQNSAFRGKTGRANFSGTSVHDSRVQFDVDGITADVYLTDKDFARHFFTMLQCSNIITNNIECRFWIKALAEEGSRIHIRD